MPIDETAKMEIRNETARRVVNVVCNHTGSTFTIDEPIYNLGFDSIGVLGLLLDIEDEFEIDIEEDEVSIRNPHDAPDFTIRQLIETVERKLAKGEAVCASELSRA